MWWLWCLVTSMQWSLSFTFLLSRGCLNQDGWPAETESGPAVGREASPALTVACKFESRKGQETSGGLHSSDVGRGSRGGARA